MNKFQISANPEFGYIAVLAINYQPYFFGKEIATVLRYTDTDKAISEYVDDESKVFMILDATDSKDANTPAEQNKILLIDEAGLFDLIFSSKSPSAKTFKNWIISEVLPSLFFGARPNTMQDNEAC